MTVQPIIWAATTATAGAGGTGSRDDAGTGEAHLDGSVAPIRSNNRRDHDPADRPAVVALVSAAAAGEQSAWNALVEQVRVHGVGHRPGSSPERRRRR